MKKITKISIISIITIFLILLGFSQYSQKVKKSPTYTTMHATNKGAIIFGGLSQDRSKVESFKRDFEKNDYVNQYWDCLHKADNYADKGDYANAIVEEEKALKLVLVSRNAGDVWQVRTGLARLYEKTGKYDLAIEQYDWLIPYQEEAVNNSASKGYKSDVNRREKIVNDLKESRKRVEGLKAKSGI